MNKIKYKLVLLGESGVGKTCIVSRLIHKEFKIFIEPTIGASFMTHSVERGDNVIEFDIWDTAGQERYKALAPLYYKNASVALIVYDITSKDSFVQAKHWYNRICNENNILIYLIGNKQDIIEHKNVDSSDITEFTDNKNINIYTEEVSAKTGYNIEELFNNIAIELMEKNAKPLDRDPENIIKISKDKVEEKNYCC